MIEQLSKPLPSSKFANNSTARRQVRGLMKDKKDEPRVSGNSPAQAPAAKRVEKIRSSRFEWEANSGETDNQRGEPNAARRSLMASLAGWLTKLFSGRRDFFDQDDDASPSPA